MNSPERVIRTRLHGWLHNVRSYSWSADRVRISSSEGPQNQPLWYTRHQGHRRRCASKVWRGDHFANNSVRKAVPVVSRLLGRTAEPIGAVTNVDFSHVIVRSADLSQNQFKMTKELKAHEDCRLQKAFITFLRLRWRGHSCQQQVLDTKMRKSTHYSDCDIDESCRKAALNS